MKPVQWRTHAGVMQPCEESILAIAPICCGLGVVPDRLRLRGMRSDLHRRTSLCVCVFYLACLTHCTSLTCAHTVSFSRQP